MKAAFLVSALAFLGTSIVKADSPESSYDNDVMMAQDTDLYELLVLLERSEEQQKAELAAFEGFEQDDQDFLAMFEQEDDQMEYPGKLTINYETVVETFRDEKLVDTYSVRGSHDVDLTAEELLSLLNEQGELEDPEITVMVTFTRYSDSIVTGCVLLCIIIMFSLVFTDRADDEEDEEDEEDDVEAALFSPNLTEPLNAKA